MTAAELQLLLAGREAEGVEFKPALLERRELAAYAVGIGNAGGGRLIMGASDKAPRQVQPVAPLTDETVQQLRRSIADATQIHVTIENVATPAGNVVVMTIPGRTRGQVFHTRDGRYLTRIGEDLRGLTVQELDAIRQEAVVELSAATIAGDWRQLVRAAGMEELRALMTEARAEADLLRQDDADLLRALAVLTPEGQLRAAGLLLVGRSEAIEQHFPHAHWRFFRMVADTDYDKVERGYDCLTVALRRLRDLVNADNPIVTVKGELVHAEFPRYPHLAVRELLVNALAHRDFTIAGGVTLKLYPDRLELTNPGGFAGDITPANILHHASLPRYGCLFGALTRIRVANAANLGVNRVYRELLSEGKEPPDYTTTGQTVTVTVFGQDARPAFIALSRAHPDLPVDGLLVIHYLTRHREISARQAAEVCQRSVANARDLLARLATRERLVELGGPPGRGRYYRLSLPAYTALGEALSYHVDSRLSQENLKGRILTALARGPLSNADIREITQLSRMQVTRLLWSLRDEGLVELRGSTKGGCWHLRSAEAPDSGQPQDGSP
jgi:ATP-dependent DNA helicase RecG